MEKKKLKLEEVSIQSFVTTLDNDSKDTVKGAAMAFSTDCLTAGTFIVKCCAISLGQPEICLSAVSVISLSIAWDSALKNCGSVKICFAPPANPSAGCHTEDGGHCSGPRNVCA